MIRETTALLAALLSPSTRAQSVVPQLNMSLVRAQVSVPWIPNALTPPTSRSVSTGLFANILNPFDKAGTPSAS